MFENLLKNELEKGKMYCKKKKWRSSNYAETREQCIQRFTKKYWEESLLRSYESRIPQKKDRGTETSEEFALLTEEIEKKKKAEKKVLELQMMMDEDQKIDTAIEIKVLRDACAEEAKLRRDLEADGLEKKLQMKEFKMKLKVFYCRESRF